MTITRKAPAGASTFEFDKGQVLRRTMNLQGTLDSLLVSVLPHEIAHTIFADYVGKPVIRWADEGGAVLSENKKEQQRHDQLATTILKTAEHAIPLRRLVAMTDYPHDEVLTLYVEGHSLTHFLVNKKDRKTFSGICETGLGPGAESSLRHPRPRRAGGGLAD